MVAVCERKEVIGVHNDIIEKLDRLLAECKSAEQIALEHYDELVMRERTFTLYGPREVLIGAAIPGKVIPIKSRKLTKVTRRKNYLIYELDSSYNLLRVKSMRNNRIDCIFQCFQMNGVFYAIPFKAEEKKLHLYQRVAICFDNGKPSYTLFHKGAALFTHFYEYISDQKMITTAYMYSTNSSHSNVEYGDRSNLYLEKGVWEEDAVYTDFSSFF